MTTAVRPGNGKTWEQVFEGYPDKHPVWEAINEILYRYALAGRFGFKNMPHQYKRDVYADDGTCQMCDKTEDRHEFELPLDEQVFLAAYRSFKTEAWTNRFSPVKAVETDDNEADSDTISFFKTMGIWFWLYVYIGMTNPQVGHFVGRGFDGNEKAADTFLGVK